MDQMWVSRSPSPASTSYASPTTTRPPQRQAWCIVQKQISRSSTRAQRVIVCQSSSDSEQAVVREGDFWSQSLDSLLLRNLVPSPEDSIHDRNTPWSRTLKKSNMSIQSSALEISYNI